MCIGAIYSIYTPVKSGLKQWQSLFGIYDPIGPFTVSNGHAAHNWNRNVEARVPEPAVLGLGVLQRGSNA